METIIKRKLRQANVFHDVLCLEQRERNGYKNEKYHKSQIFNEILIGGECPVLINGENKYECQWSIQGNHWFHQHSTNNQNGESISRIYMPFLDQLLNNIDVNCRHYNYGEYAYLSAHETGHSVGLFDGYPTKE